MSSPTKRPGRAASDRVLQRGTAEDHRAALMGAARNQQTGHCHGRNPIGFWKAHLLPLVLPNPCQVAGPSDDDGWGYPPFLLAGGQNPSFLSKSSGQSG